MEAGRTERRGRRTGFSPSVAGAGGNPGPRPVRRPRAGVHANLDTRAAPGLRPGALRPPARSWLTAAGLALKAQPPAVESAARRRTNAAVERREARRPASSAGDPWRSRDRPDRKAGHGCGVPHQRLPALCPPSILGAQDDGAPRAAKNRGGGALALKTSMKESENRCALFHPTLQGEGRRPEGAAGWGT